MTGSPVRLSKRRLFKMLGYTPHPAQLEIHKSRAPRRVVACGVRFGKTVCAAMDAIAAAMEPRERSIGWVCAPTYDLADRVFREVQLIVMTHLKHRVITMREHDRKLVLRNMGGGISELRGKSADNPVSLLGEGLDWVIIDEASRLKPDIWESHLSQRLLDKRGWALLISTPKGKGYFYDLYRRGQGDDEDYASWNYPSWKNPLLDADLIEAERGRLPERVFNQEYGAQFVEGAGAVFRDVRECATGKLQDPVEHGRYVAGLDLAKIEDYTVLVIMNQAGEVVAFDRFHRIDWSMQVARIHALAARYGNPVIQVDSTGAGEPILESLLKEGCNAKAYPFTAKSKAALINNLALMLEKRAIVLPQVEAWPELVDEMEAYRYSVSTSGNVKMDAPYGSHDDTVCALALAAWNLRQRRENTSIPVGAKVFRAEGHRLW